MNKVRCAIYTRKSTEDGLEQGFNSLHAQRDACAAYIMSQTSEGWTLVPDHYDDGGISGGTLERPALRRMLADIASGKIDTVVVYKVDRLTRSLMDFSTLVQTLDAAGTSFVSVTQSFNTTTSMGRLTLNMLLSFAQFEREVTAERIRDKIAASKAKGMWMGGVAPIGYKPAGRTLEIVDDHAGIVKRLFEIYLEVGSVRDLQHRLIAEGVITPVRQTVSGKPIGGGSFGRGQLYLMLKNRTYVGEIEHKGQVYAGLHPALIDRELWDAVQAQLSERTNGQAKPRAAHPSLLAGLIFDPDDQPMVATHACKGKRRYRYYVSKGLQVRAEEIDGPGIRMPALEIEGAVSERLADAFDEPLSLVANASLPLDSNDLAGISAAALGAAERIRSRDREFIRQLIARVQIDEGGARIGLSTAALATALEVTLREESRMVEIRLDAQLSRSGRAVRLIQTDGQRAGGARVDEPLISLLSKAHRWWGRLREGETNVAALAREEGLSRSYVSNALRMAFLSPRIVERIVSGDQPARFYARTLLQGRFPDCWKSQAALLAS